MSSLNENLLTHCNKQIETLVYMKLFLLKTIINLLTSIPLNAPKHGSTQTVTQPCLGI